MLYTNFKSIINNWIAQSPSTRDLRKHWSLIKRKKYKKSLSNLFNIDCYDHNFFEDHVALKLAYKDLANIISSSFDLGKVCDIGCGNGYLINYLFQKGVEVRGYDSSKSALNYIEPELQNKVKIINFSQVQDLPSCETAISIEVAEHIHKKYSDNFIKNITNIATKNIIFSAAKPGQWGDGHINCQPQSYWIDLFNQNGWKYKLKVSNNFNECIGNSQKINSLLYWLPGNFMIFDKK